MYKAREIPTSLSLTAFCIQDQMELLSPFWEGREYTTIYLHVTKSPFHGRAGEQAATSDWRPRGTAQYPLSRGMGVTLSGNIQRYVDDFEGSGK